MRKLAALLTGCILFFSGCAGRSPAPAAATVFAMNTVMQLTVYGSEEALADAQTYLFELEAELSVTDPNSAIYAINQTGSGRLSAEASDLLGRALALCRRTDGALDVSVYPVVRAWGFTTGEYSVPAPETLAQLLDHVDYTRIHLDPETGTVTLPAGMEIDLGSVAKGYAGDRLAARLREQGVTCALLNLGGNMQAVGTKPDGSPWRIAVQDPSGTGILGVLELADQAAVTSGGYERYFEADGETYWHIMDPATGAPARSGLISVTIVGDSGLVCDGLSTALFVMGLEDAAALWRSSGDFEAVLVREDGQIYITEGLEDIFTPGEGVISQEIEVIRRNED